MDTKSVGPTETDKVSPVHQEHQAEDQATNNEKTVTTIDSFPSEVLEHILAVGSNVSSLKTWRCVSKSWNELSCRILRRASAVPLNAGNDNDEKDLEHFKDLLIDRLENFPSDWPSPFQNFKIVEASSIATNLIRFAQRSNVKITTLKMIHDKGFDPLTFGNFLEQIKTDLIHLKIRGNSDADPFLTPTDNLCRGSWRSLKSLSLKDTCKPVGSTKSCPHVQFINALKTSLKLKSISLVGGLSNIMRIFEKEDGCWDLLLRLELHSTSPPSNVTPEQVQELMTWTKDINFCPLTHLKMWFTNVDSSNQTSEQYTPYLLPLIQKSSQVLVGLRTTFMPLSLLPSLPNLNHLTCVIMDGDRIQDITEHKFPSLTSVHCILRWTEIPTYVKPKDFENNKNVGTVTIFWSNAVPAGVTQDLLWHILSAHFPNLKSLKVKTNVSSLSLHAIRKRLPQLQDLQLRAADSSELLGSSSSGHAYSAKGWPCDSYENCALLDMTDLTRLQLGDYLSVSHDLMSVCLGKMLRLEFLSFYWNNTLEPSDVPVLCGHIKDVTIFCNGTQQKRELKKLTNTMKNLKLIKY